MAGNDFGSFIPTTAVLDVNEVYDTEVTSKAFKELIVRLIHNFNNMSLSMNTRDAGFYDTQEFINGQLFFPNTALSSSTAQYPAQRQVFRKVVNFGALPNNATKTAAHGLTITAGYTFTRIYGATTRPSTAFLPLPYASTTAANSIELWVDGTNINVKTGINYTAYTVTYIVLEYLKF
jgi:hypothetical protein